MKSVLARAARLLVVAPLALPAAAGAQPTSIKLFDATPTFATGPQTSPGEALPFASTALVLHFAPGDTALISSTPDGSGPIVVDNFLVINGQNVCQGAPGQEFPESCFGPRLDPALPVGRPIETVLTPIAPLDVSAFMPAGSGTVLFELRDFGEIAGNTDLFLVTTAAATPAQPPTVASALDRTVELLGGELRPVLVEEFQRAFDRQVTQPVLAGLRKAKADPARIAEVERQLTQASALLAADAATTAVALLDGRTLVGKLPRDLGRLFQQPGAAPVSIQSFIADVGTPKIRSHQSIHEIQNFGFDPEQVDFQWKNLAAEIVFRQDGVPQPVFAEAKVKGEVSGEKGEKGKKPDTAKGKLTLEIKGNPTPGTTATLSIAVSGQVSRDGAGGSVTASFEWKF